MNNERNRAWRRAQSWTNNGKGMGSEDTWKPEKKWKLMYIRSEKMARARQLGFDYPIRSTLQLLDEWHVDKR